MLQWPFEQKRGTEIKKQGSKIPVAGFAVDI